MTRVGYYNIWQTDRVFFVYPVTHLAKNLSELNFDPTDTDGYILPSTYLTEMKT